MGSVYELLNYYGGELGVGGRLFALKPSFDNVQRMHDQGGDDSSRKPSYGFDKRWRESIVVTHDMVSIMLMPKGPEQVRKELRGMVE